MGKKDKKGKKPFLSYSLFWPFLLPPRDPKKEAGFVNLLDIRLATDVAQRLTTSPRLAQYLLLQLLTPCNR